MLGARFVLRNFQSYLSPATKGATILAYHLVEGETGSVVDLSRTAFVTQLEIIRQKYKVVALNELDPQGSPRQVVLTFDDAYENFYTVIWPILKTFNFPATLYVPIDFIDGGPAPIRNTTLAPCTWSQLTTLVKEGVELGSHTFSHPDLDRVSPTELHRELIESKLELERRTGANVTSFCYPRGLRSRRAGRQLDTVYKTSTIGGGLRISTHRTHLERTSIRNDHRIEDFHSILNSKIWLEEALADVVRQVRR